MCDTLCSAHCGSGGCGAPTLRSCTVGGLERGHRLIDIKAGRGEVAVETSGVASGSELRYLDEQRTRRERHARHQHHVPTIGVSARPLSVSE